MADLQKRLLEAFKMECPEHIAGIRSSLRASQGATDFEEAFYTIMRHAHTLKGAARAAGLLSVERAAHQLETAFSEARERQKEPDEEFLGAVHHLLDLIEQQMARDFPTGAQLPTLSELMQGDSPKRETVDDEARPDSPLSPAVSGDLAVRLSEKAVDSLLKGAGEMLSQEGVREKEYSRLVEMRGLVKELVSLHRDANAPERALEGKLEELGRLSQALMKEHQASTSRFRQTSRHFHAAVSDVRLVSADGVFEGMGRMVRGVARDQGKKVRYLTRGLETRVDRAVLQQLREPILHTLRNAVHHGIETPREREASGKPETGTIELALEMDGNRLSVEIRDDGRGVQEEVLLAKAKERGLQGSLEELLMIPHLTTADGISEIAGRGMGLSIVRNVLDSLQGSWNVASEPKRGTRFLYQVPVSGFSQLLVFVSSLGQVFAIRSHAVRAMLSLPPERVEQVEGRPMLSFEDRMLPIGELSELISSGYPMKRYGDKLSVLILQHGSHRAAVLVDGITDCRNVMVRPSQVPGMPRETFAGTVLNEDGTVSLVLNVRPLVRKLAFGQTSTLTRAGFDKEEVVTPDWPASILVVDDSITTRTLERSILEANAYHVLVAVDGVEALTVLETNKVNLVISDVEMPNLDGFGLLERMKKRSDLRDIPVILLTSRRELEDQKRGLDLGAEAYLVKQDFDQVSLLETVRQII